MCPCSWPHYDRKSCQAATQSLNAICNASQRASALIIIIVIMIYDDDDLFIYLFIYLFILNLVKCKYYKLA